MKLKELVGHLEGVKTWRQPNSELEQYPTPPDIAAHMLLAAESRDGLADALIADLGCGGGVLGLGAAMMGASHVLAFDIDSQALEVAAENVAEFEVPVDLVCCDVLQLSLRRQALGAASRTDGATPAEGRSTGLFDVVLMNPPFGTRPDNNGVDVAFLRAGLALCRPGGSLYTLHKTATRAFIGKTAAELGAASEVVAELKFEIPRMYKHHRKASVDVAVDFWRIQDTSR
jgi:predicted RNA methylase